MYIHAVYMRKNGSMVASYSWKMKWRKSDPMLRHAGDSQHV